MTGPAPKSFALGARVARDGDPSSAGVVVGIVLRTDRGAMLLIEWDDQTQSVISSAELVSRPD